MNETEYITVKEFQSAFPGILRGLKHNIVITRYGDDLCTIIPTAAAGELDSGRRRRTDRAERDSSGTGLHEDGEAGQESAHAEPVTDDSGVSQTPDSF